MKCLFEKDGKRHVKRIAPGEHVPGFIQITSDPVTFPAAEDPADEARIDQAEREEEARVAAHMAMVAENPPEPVDPNYSKERVEALESEIGRLDKALKDVLAKYTSANKKAEEKALADLSGVNMKWLVEGADGLHIMELGPGKSTNMKRICAMPSDFTESDVDFVTVGQHAVVIDYVARDKFLKEAKWNAKTPFERLAHAIRPKPN